MLTWMTMIINYSNKCVVIIIVIVMVPILLTRKLYECEHVVTVDVF